ncbi:golgin subfamily A member 6-like protein 26 [Macrobrachium rosenbergii]|uniref:golgin subfamily A member 6-like protein 26 n=1 Tax=Macrobrachium rosenbergii TaxID=79674 RepID=UPI0034D73302
MFALFYILFVALLFVGVDLYASIIEDWINFFCRQEVNSGLHVAAAVDSLEPEIVQEPNSLLAPDFAVAKPGLALLAGLALAVYWKCKFYGPKYHELEQCLKSECHESEDDHVKDITDSEDLGTDVYDSEDDVSDSENDLSDSDDDLSDSDDDLEMDMSDNDDLSDSDDDLEMDMSDTDDDFETDMTDVEDHSETEMSLVSRLEDSLELEDSDNYLETQMSTEEDEQMELMDREIQLPRPRRDQPDMEKQRLQEALEISQVYGTRMENLWKEAMEKTVWLQNQLLEKDILLEKNAQEIGEMKMELENVHLQKEQVLAEKRRLEEDLELAQDRAERTEDLNKELKEKTASLQQVMVDKEEKEEELTSVKKELENEKMRTQILEAEVQVMKNWVAELGGENARQQEELDNRNLQIQTFSDMERKLICEKEELQQKLSVALNHGKELDSLLEEADEKARKMANDFEEEVQKRDNQIRDLLAQEEKLKAEKLVLEGKFEITVNLQMKERMEHEQVNSQWHQKLQEKDREMEILRKEEEDSREQSKEMESKLRNLFKERNSLLREVEKQSTEYQLLIDEKERETSEMRMDYQEMLNQKDTEIEKLRESEEELLQLRKECQKLKENWKIKEEGMIREQRRLRDRQTRLEEALKDHDKYMLMTLLHGTAQRNFHLEQIALQHGNEILDASEKERQEQDLCMRKEKQHREYCDTQRDRTNYGNQWEVLTQTLTDIVHGDERMPETTTGDSNSENLADKTCHQNNDDKMCKVEPLRSETHEEKEG